jgi:hypothetical protein
MERAPLLRGNPKRTVLLMMTKAPVLKITGSDPRIIADVRILGWKEIRMLAGFARCTVTEKRIGLITKRFEISGNQDQLQQLLAHLWVSPVLGRHFRDMLREMADDGEDR